MEGLSSTEAKKRLAQYGENELEGKKRSIWLELLTFFWGPIPWMIEIAAILSGYLERWPDLIMILALLFINAALGFFQEFKANNAIEALKSKLALKARVMRDGKWQDIPAKELVPGDLVDVKLGNILPADLKLNSGDYLSVDQSALTGESLPVEKKVGDEAYSGTIAKMGEMTGEVIATGMQTKFGKTAKLVETAKSRSHFQQAILKIGNFLIFSTLVIASILFIVDLFRIEVTHTVYDTIGNTLIFLLILVIAGIPVALPAVLSMTMAIGASKMAAMKAIVSKLSSIEELAGMDILCSDKTGTLTKNQLTVGDVTPFGDVSAEDVLYFGALASTATSEDAIDGAILEANKKEVSDKIVKFTPFDPVGKRSEGDYGAFKVTKGAPQVILALANPDQKLQSAVNASMDDFAKRGFRTLGIAKSTGDAWQFLGLIPLFDPPREDTVQTVHTAKEMGVKIKMVTGDNIAIAKEISKSLDLGENITTIGDTLDENADGYAEVFPEHKFKIIESLQGKEHIVGMTGDGVNDAPALKQADIGVAVSNATDAARAAADLILTKPGLMVITKAIEEARKIFGRMKSYAMYRISETCRLLLFLFLSMLIFQTHPLTAVMIIIIALLNDIPIMMIAYDHMIIEENPVKWDMREIMTVAIGLSVIGVISTFCLYWIGEAIWHLPDDQKSTLAFLAILCGGNLTIYLTRNTGFFWQRPFPEIKFFLATLFSQIAGTLIAVYGLGTSDFVGIGWKYVGYSWIYIAIWFGICALTKMALYALVGDKTIHHKRFFRKMQTTAHPHSTAQQKRA